MRRSGHEVRLSLIPEMARCADHGSEITQTDFGRPSGRYLCPAGYLHELGEDLLIDEYGIVYRTHEKEFLGVIGNGVVDALEFLDQSGDWAARMVLPFGDDLIERALFSTDQVIILGMSFDYQSSVSRVEGFLAASHYKTIVVSDTPVTMQGVELKKSLDEIEPPFKLVWFPHLAANLGEMIEGVLIKNVEYIWASHAQSQEIQAAHAHGIELINHYSLPMEYERLSRNRARNPRNPVYKA